MLMMFSGNMWEKKSLSSIQADNMAVSPPLPSVILLSQAFHVLLQPQRQHKKRKKNQDGSFNELRPSSLNGDIL